MKTTLVTLMTEFTCNKIGAEGIVSVSFYKNKSDEEENHKFRIMNAQDNQLDACLSKPSFDLYPYTDEAQLLISNRGILRSIYHVFYLFDFANDRKVIAYDIANNHDANYFFDINSHGNFKTLPLKRIPHLLLR